MDPPAGGPGAPADRPPGLADASPASTDPGGFQIDSLWEPFSFQIGQDRWIRQEIRRPDPGPLAGRIIEALCPESEAGISSCGELMGSSPPLADRFRWRIGVESSGRSVRRG